MKSDVSSILRSLDPNRLTSARGVLALFKELSDSVGGENREKIEAAVTEAEEDVSFAEKMLDNLMRTVYHVQLQNHAELPTILTSISTGIFDTASAMTAATIHDKRWFSQLVMSDDDKVQIATALRQAVGRHAPHYTALYEKIEQMDPAIMEEIRYPIVEGEE